MLSDTETASKASIRPTMKAHTSNSRTVTDTLTALAAW